MTQSNGSLASWVQSWPTEKKAQWIANLTPADAVRLEYEWSFWARPKQLPPPGDWLTWVLCGGRGAGKTRTAVEWVHSIADQSPRGTRIAIMGRTAREVREIMIEGESGLKARNRPWNAGEYKPGVSRFEWPNGVIGTLYTADVPDSLRGGQHHYFWADEMATYRYPDAFKQLKLGLRLGAHPRGVVTTTPRPTKAMRELLASPTSAVVTETTYANLRNLAPTFAEQILTEFEGTRMGRQELLAEMLTDSPNALFNRDTDIEAHRVTVAPPLRRVVVGVDPAATSKARSNNTGIIVAGIAANKHYYVIQDATMHDKPPIWAAQAVTVYHTHKADRLVAEVNNGGDMVEALVRVADPRVAYKSVTAARGKQTRAEPIAALYQQGRVHHVGAFVDLEDEMCSYDPLAGSESPDRLDALVWCLTELHSHTGRSYAGWNADLSPKRSSPLEGV